ncbi:MAG: ATP-binding protein [Prevotella sp.]|nr:ATP-binding protein [Prevotella sp.]
MTTENPFVFGKAAEGTYFTDRAEDAKRLTANLTHGINTILISPRRWGKTSLVKKVISEMDRIDIKPVFIDIFQCKSEYEFYHAFATAVIKQTSSKFDEWVEMGKTFLANVSPKFSFGSDPMNDFSLSFEWNPKDDTEIDILQLPERIAQKKNVRLVVCLDEFQQMADFADSVKFQKKLRSVWQHQQNVTYCVFGSKKHLMENIFNDKSMPFYKFGDMMFLQKIPTEEWVPFICDKFKETGKIISREQAAKICEATENLSSYVQHLAWVVWYKSDKIVTDKNIADAIDDLLEQNKAFFQREVEQLSELQLNFLRALANGVTNGFSRKDVIKKYRLESSANVQSIKKSLLKKDLIDIDSQNITFNDSLFKQWLKRQKFYE